MRVALYARVSTERQEQQGTIASQLDAIRGFARDQQHDIVDDYVCVDEGYSGTRLDRPGLDRLRDGAEAGAFEAVVILCPDRLARKYAYQVVILEELERYGVRVLFLEQPPSDDPHARLLTQIQGAIAEYERMKITERYRRGKLFRARQGEVTFWKVPYGYRRCPRRDAVPAHLEIAEAEAQVVRQIFAWHVHERLSVRQIALRLTASPHLTATGRQRWGPSTVDRMLHNEAYIGRMYVNRHEALAGDLTTRSGRRPVKRRTRCRPTAEWIPLTVPPLIDADLFHRSQAIHLDNSRFSPRHLKSGHYLLRGVVRCRVCDLSMSCHRMRGRDGTWHHYYYCTGHDVLRARGAVGPCPQRNLRADALDDLVWTEVRRHLENPALIATAHARLHTEPIAADVVAQDIRDLQKKRAECDREDHRLLDAYQAGLIPLDQLGRRQELLRQRRAHVTDSLEARQHHQAAVAETAQLHLNVEAFVRRINGPLATLSFEQQQQVVRTVVDRAMVEDGRVDIHFAIPIPPPPSTPPTPADEPVSTFSRLRSNDRNDFRVVREPIDQRDRTGRVGKDGVPLLEEQIGRNDDRALFVASTDDLKQEVGRVGVIGQIADLIDRQDLRTRVGAQPPFEGAGGVLAIQIQQQVRGGDEERGVAGEDRLVQQVFRQHGFAEPLRSDQDDILSLGDEVEREDPVDGGPVQVLGPGPVEVREGFEAPEPGRLQLPLKASASAGLEFGVHERVE